METAKNPYLLISASFHRSGSTWFQRSISAGYDIIIWGESGSFVSSLRSMRDDWAKRDLIAERQLHEFLQRGGSPDIWIANMNPATTALIEAQREMMRCLFSQRHGRHRWGWKAVTYDRVDLDFLLQLFPNLKIVLLIRNLRDVYVSLRARSWHLWWKGGALEIGREWAARSLSYFALANEGKAILIRYEEAMTSLQNLHEFIGLEEKAAGREFWKVSVSATPRSALSAEECRDLQHGAGDALDQLGYSIGKYEGL